MFYLSIFQLNLSKANLKTWRTVNFERSHNQSTLQRHHLVQDKEEW